MEEILEVVKPASEVFEEGGLEFEPYNKHVDYRPSYCWNCGSLLFYLQHRVLTEEEVSKHIDQVKGDKVCKTKRHIEEEQYCAKCGQLQSINIICLGAKEEDLKSR